MIKIKYIHTMDFDWENVLVMNANNLTEFEKKIENSEFIKIATEDKRIYGINSDYIIYWEE